MKVREKFTADLIQAEVDIRLQYPLLSLVKRWMDKQLSDVRVSRQVMHQFLPFKHILLSTGQADERLPLEVSWRSDRSLP